MLYIKNLNTNPFFLILMTRNISTASSTRIPLQTVGTIITVLSGCGWSRFASFLPGSQSVVERKEVDIAGISVV